MSPEAVRVRPAEGLDDVPGLAAGVTLRGSERGGEDDFGLATGGPAWRMAERYVRLARSLGFPAVAVALQVHGAELAAAADAPARGLWIPGEADGFVGVAPGRLFVVTVADCVPVYLVDPEARAFALVHAGWRGAAAGILDRALDRLSGGRDRLPGALRMHLGPAICGDCYEVGPEVPRAFGREPSPDAGGR
ncbi:MAG: laccase domain-containing protein, partial [Gemmatimonadota bacterium]